MSVENTNDKKYDIRKFCQELSELKADSAITRLFQLKAKILELSFQYSDKVGRSVPPVLFHYTTTYGMNGILATGHEPILRISDIRDLNDKDEAKRGLSILNRSLSQNDKCLEITKEVESMTCENSIGCISFTDNPDDVMMWMCYAERGSGVSLGFDTRKLLYANDFSLSCVIYDEEQQSKFMDDFVSELVKFREDLEKLKSDKRSIRDWTTWAILTAVLSVKASAWKFESEWRLVRWGHVNTTEFEDGLFKRRENFNLTQNTYTTPQSNDELSKKIKEFYNWQDKKISTIIIGPKISTDSAEIENWSETSGCKGVDVRKSDAPLR